MIKTLAIMMTATILSGVVHAVDTSVASPSGPMIYEMSRFTVKTEQVAEGIYLMRRVR